MTAIVKRIRLRSGLVTLVLLIGVGVAWFYFAPTKIGGSTRYVVTRGISMEPRFHTGDLAIVRPASNYRVGEIVAYWSTVLHTVVFTGSLPRTAIRMNSRETTTTSSTLSVLTAPSSSASCGYVPHAGRVLEMLHTRVAAALLCAVVGLLTLFGVKDSQQRRRRRRKDATGSGRRKSQS